MNTKNNFWNICASTVAPLVLRIALGVIFIAHGSQKLLGAFDGPGIQGTAGYFTSLGIQPAKFMALMVALVEFGGGIALLLGFLTRLAAAGITVTMIVAVSLIHGKKGFFADGGGFEYNLALIGMGVALMLMGAGSISLDHLGRKLCLRCNKR